ncbi:MULTISPECIES: metal-dependent hydrolase [Helicobacter]|uniref:Metal-dependent hydrolase n=1 Tax=Helicobacter ibis TaxID=2962633 RepID=A0ABT4VFY0_9HELI|nr:MULTISPECIES: metal-dependent hydrolase [Helicobacter]MDA3967960.1 metal-dependent hydrolase [Helicobacter sp. WB40]MDA3969628.1 metal-dependent hydrolase [Helicobacter ibis]
MLGKTHIAFALGATSSVVYVASLGGALLDVGEVSLFYLAVAFGALLPDIDEPNSTLGRKTLGISNIIKTIFGHRGFTHSAFCVFFLCAMLIFLYVLLEVEVFLNSVSSFLGEYGVTLSSESVWILCFGLVCGYVLHIAGDMLTISGVPILLPFRTKSYFLLPKPFRFKTGGVFDYMICAFSVALFGFINFKIYGINLAII